MTCEDDAIGISFFKTKTSQEGARNIIVIMMVADEEGMARADGVDAY